MENYIDELYIELYQLVGLYKKFLEIVREEEALLIKADVKLIQEILYSKEVLLNSLSQTEKNRLAVLKKLENIYKCDSDTLTLEFIAKSLDGKDAVRAAKLRATQNTLRVIVERVREQNTKNQNLAENALVHISQMKTNLIGEQPSQMTYTAKGKSTQSSKNTSLIQKEL